MIKKLYLLLFLSMIPTALYSQNNAIASFDLPVNNSFKFNKYLINPTFSFVREDYSAINFYNKRQWSQFENPPQVYFINYSGKVGENSSSSIGLYQQNYGVLTNFGAQINYAYNVPVSDDSNLTFGFNLYYYNSAFNIGKIITNSPEPLLQSADSNSLIAFKPGINFGAGFFDFGFTVNNLFLYNLKTSQMVANDQGKSYVGHIMYTGYMTEAQGLFERAKFSALFQAEKKKDITSLSGNVILDAPNGGWIQGGYNTIYGISAGLGILITKNIAVGYNYEKGLGDISKLGANHEITFAYIFKNYNDDDYEPLLFKSKPQPQVQLPKIDIAEKKQKDLEIIANRERLATEATAKIKIAQEAKAEKLKQTVTKENNTKLENEKLKADKERIALESINLKKAADAKSVADGKIKAENEKLALETIKAKKIAEAKIIEKQNQVDLQKAATNKLKAVKAAKDLADAAKAATLQEIADSKAEKERIALEAINLKKVADAKSVADGKIKAENEKLALETAKAKKIAEAKIIEKQNQANTLKEANNKLKAAKEAKDLADAEKETKLQEIADSKAEKERIALEAINLKKVADAKSVADGKIKAENEKLALEAEKAAANKEAKIAAEFAKQKAITDAKLIADAEKLANDNKILADNAAKTAAEIEKQKAIAESKKLSDAARQKAITDAKAIEDAKKVLDEAKVVADKMAKEKAIADAKVISDAKKLADNEKAAADKATKAAAELEKQKATADAKAVADAKKALEDAKIATENQEKIIADAAKQKAAAEAKAILEIEKQNAIAKAKATADAKKLADADKIIADREAKIAAENAKIKAVADAKAAADKKVLFEKQEKEKIIAEAKAKAERIESIKSGDVVSKELDKFKSDIDFKSNESTKLISRYDSLVKARNTDLQDFKNEGATNADGTAKVRKKFVSATEANKIVEKLKSDIEQNKIVFDNLINEFEAKNNDRIKNLKAKGISDSDSKTLNDSYLQSLNALKAKRDNFIEKEKQLSTEVESIKAAKELEIRNRIKRAQFDNENEQIKKNQAALDLLNKNTSTNSAATTVVVPTSTQSATNSSELTIIRNISGIESGFYLVLDTFTTTDARDNFVSRAIAAGAKNVNSFFNFNNNLHYVYIENYSDISAALEAQKARGTKPYNTKMFTVKVVN